MEIWVTMIKPLKMWMPHQVRVQMMILEEEVGMNSMIPTLLLKQRNSREVTLRRKSPLWRKTDLFICPTLIEPEDQTACCYLPNYQDNKTKDQVEKWCKRFTRCKAWTTSQTICWIFQQKAKLRFQLDIRPSTRDREASISITLESLFILHITKIEIIQVFKE